MGYAGFERALCRAGHLHIADCYNADFTDKQWRTGILWNCPDCGESLAWWEAVDQTNNPGVQIALREHEPAKLCRCQQCGHQHQAAAPRYCIPRLRSPDLEPLVPVAHDGYEVLETGEVFPTEVIAWERIEEIEQEREREHQQFLQDLETQEVS